MSEAINAVLAESTRTPAIERLMRHVVQVDGHWLWIGTMIRGSPNSMTPQFRRDDDKRVNPCSVLHGRELPRTMQWRATCGSRNCIKPEHTQAVFIRDFASQQARRGADHAKVRLTKEQVVEAREAVLVRADESCTDVAKRMGVPKEIIANAVAGRTWRHVPGAGTVGKRVYRCGKCGARGHNKATCMVGDEP